MPETGRKRSVFRLVAHPPERRKIPPSAIRACRPLLLRAIGGAPPNGL